ncbi:hypothetical protein Ddye_014743 [Dipteronia dyeriana]|uniref:MADS-box domain-containing protein n=1 Tax=Dipteronia dyeriana TaxID=168575 RepID=A0AAD9X8U6_9ROSI|nr:hypothetical protein Ddye_014743 [Dipteronia dyeriana]
MTEPVKNNRLKSFNYKYNRRKTTLMKKANQLSKLCVVKVCMVCFGPDKTVETWPENRSEVCDIISKYKSGCLSNMGRVKKHNLNLRDKINLKNKKKNQEALVIHSPPDNNNNNIDHNLNMFNNVYQPPQPLWFSGDCSSFNQQAFSSSDALLGRAENLSVCKG